MLDAALPTGWQAVYGLQQYLENNKWLDASSLAAEEALTGVLDAFVSGEAVTDAEINRSFHSRRVNRRRRNRQREKLVSTYANKSIRAELEEKISDPSIEVENVDYLRVVEMKMDASNFSLLKRIANGTSYSELAADQAMSEASLRTQVCRARAKARSHAA